MWTSVMGYLETVHTLLEYGAAVGAKDNVRNQMIIMMTIIIVLNFMMKIDRCISDDNIGDVMVIISK